MGLRPLEICLLLLLEPVDECHHVLVVGRE